MCWSIFGCASFYIHIYVQENRSKMLRQSLSILFVCEFADLRHDTPLQSEFNFKVRNSCFQLDDHVILLFNFILSIEIELFVVRLLLGSCFASRFLSTTRTRFDNFAGLRIDFADELSSRFRLLLFLVPFGLGFISATRSRTV